MRKSRAAGFAAAAGMFLFGLATALLGAILPLLAARVHFNLRDAGTLFLVLNLGVFLCVFGLGRWIDQSRRKNADGGRSFGCRQSRSRSITVAPDFSTLLSGRTHPRQLAVAR